MTTNEEAARIAMELLKHPLPRVAACPHPANFPGYQANPEYQRQLRKHEVDRQAYLDYVESVEKNLRARGEI
jgi:hypothetical protein